MQEQKNQPVVSQTNQLQQQITAQTVEQFNKVCKDATDLMLSYKQQSEDLKNQITSMVTIYNKNANPNQAVPIQKIIQITNSYETQMRNAHKQYEYLQNQLHKQEAERNNMMLEIQQCFTKLERMEKIIRQKKAKQQLKKTEQETQNSKKQQSNQKSEVNQTKQQKFS